MCVSFQLLFIFEYYVFLLFLSYMGGLQFIYSLEGHQIAQSTKEHAWVHTFNLEGSHHYPTDQIIAWILPPENIWLLISRRTNDLISNQVPTHPPPPIIPTELGRHKTLIRDCTCSLPAHSHSKSPGMFLHTAVPQMLGFKTHSSTSTNETSILKTISPYQKTVAKNPLLCVSWV